MTAWGIVATAKAPAEDILRFAAHHLDAGAHRVFVYLDAPNPEARAALKAHPRCRVTFCGEAHWQELAGGRPQKHQIRQSLNATHAYGRAAGLDWLAHIDVDEFLVSGTPPGDLLAALGPAALTARARPMEQLAGDGTAFKAFIPPGPDRQRLAEEIYPTFGRYLKGGFLSHVAGKVFIRTGLSDVKLRIHKAVAGGRENPGMEEVPALSLAHCHAPSWEAWQASYRYRLQHGSYRAELGDTGGLTLHSLLKAVESDGGEAGLRAFHDEVCADTPALRARLEAHGLLRHADLALAEKRERHFPALNA